MQCDNVKIVLICMKHEGEEYKETEREEEAGGGGEEEEGRGHEAGKEASE